MDSKAFKQAVDLLSKEKGISEDIIYSAMELALISAYKKNYHSLPNVRVDINRDTGEIHVYSFKTVMNPPTEEEIDLQYQWDLEHEDDEEEDEESGRPVVIPFDERIHITLEDAQQAVPGIELGETIEEEVTPRDFGRVAAATAKQVIVQKIREAERDLISQEFGDKQDEMISGLVAMEDQRNYYIDLGRTQGILPKSDIIPGEKIKMGERIKVYINKVEIGTKGPLILLSRNHYGFVKRLFELEIPEINDGVVFIYSVAREAGVRSKVAVYSENPNVDAIGACIGERGSRIAEIMKELGSEKIDVVLYDKDPAKFIANALAPARDVHVLVMDEKKQEAMVILTPENLSLAIGKKGVNVRLSSRLTHYKLDVKTFDQAREAGINLLEA